MKRFFFGRRRNKWRGNKPSWMIPISHGHHVVEHHVIKGGSDDDSEFDSVVIQREQIDQIKLWYFGIFDVVVRDGVTKFVQSHFFGKKLKEVRNQCYVSFSKLCSVLCSTKVIMLISQIYKFIVTEVESKT